eukprot:3390040-Rhodomonas_salina.1
MSAPAWEHDARGQARERKSGGMESQDRDLRIGLEGQLGGSPPHERVVLRHRCQVEQHRAPLLSRERVFSLAQLDQAAGKDLFAGVHVGGQPPLPHKAVFAPALGYSSELFNQQGAEGLQVLRARAYTRQDPCRRVALVCKAANPPMLEADRSVGGMQVRCHEQRGLGSGILVRCHQRPRLLQHRLYVHRHRVKSLTAGLTAPFSCHSSLPSSDPLFAPWTQLLQHPM